MAKTDATYPSGSNLLGHLYRLVTAITHRTPGRNGRSELLFEAGRILGDNFESPGHSARFASHLSKIIKFDFLALAQIDHTEWTAENLLQCGVRVSGMSDGWSASLDLLPQPEVLSSDSALVCEVADVTKVEQDVAWSLHHAGVRSLISAPIHADGTVIGLMLIGAKLPNSFGEFESDTATTLADSISGSVANLRLHQRLRRELIERETISGLTKTISSSLDIAASMDDFSEEISRVVPNSGVSISVDRGAGNSNELRWATTSNSEFTPQAPRTLKAAMKIGERSVGEIEIHCHPTAKYTRHHLRLLQSLASNIAGPVAAAELHFQAMALAEANLERERFEAEKREMQRVAAAKTDFLTTISHELRTPLTSILAFADVLSKNKPGTLVEKQQHQVEIIQRNGRKLKVLIDELLDTTLHDKDNITLTPEYFDLVETSSDVVQALIPITDERDQKLEITSTGESIELEGDKFRVSQVISNLVTNASKYSPQGSSIHIALDASEDEISICIADSGIGIKPIDVPHIFSAFYRADNESTRSVSGTGIGLYFSRIIVDAHGGEINVDAKPGVGTSMTVTLPRVFAGSKTSELASAA